MIFRAINSKDKTAFLTSLPNFALNIFQEFLPRPRYPTHIIRTPLVRFDTSIFGGLAPPWTVFLVSPCSSIIATHSCFLQVHVVVWTRVDVCAPPWGESPGYIYYLAKHATFPKIYVGTMETEIIATHENVDMRDRKVLRKN